MINFSDGAFIADFFGFLLALPMALFLSFWFSAVKRRWAVVLGALLFTIIGAVIIYLWVGYPQDMPDFNPAAVFFGSLLFNSIMGLIGGMVLDLLIGRISSRDYRNTVAHE